jgi:hypothetical protein
MFRLGACGREACCDQTAKVRSRIGPLQRLLDPTERAAGPRSLRCWKTRRCTTSGLPNALANRDVIELLEWETRVERVKTRSAYLGSVGGNADVRGRHYGAWDNIGENRNDWLRTVAHKIFGLRR